MTQASFLALDEVLLLPSILQRHHRAPLGSGHRLQLHSECQSLATVPLLGKHSQQPWRRQAARRMLGLTRQSLRQRARRLNCRTPPPAPQGCIVWSGPPAHEAAEVRTEVASEQARRGRQTHAALGSCACGAHSWHGMPHWLALRCPHAGRCSRLAARTAHPTSAQRHVAGADADGLVDFKGSLGNDHCNAHAVLFSPRRGVIDGALEGGRVVCGTGRSVAGVGLLTGCIGGYPQQAQGYGS